MQMSKMLRSAMTASQPAKTTVHNTEGETGEQREKDIKKEGNRES